MSGVQHAPASGDKYAPMTEEQRQRWREDGVFPVERWDAGQGSTPLVCPLPDRELLRRLANSIPAHVQASGWYAVGPRDHHQSVYADNFRGMGRQHIASVASGKGYFGVLPEYIAAACPRTVLRLLDRIEELEGQLARATGTAAIPSSTSGGRV